MPTLETKVPTFWYAFGRQAELRAVLFQCPPDTLMSPYKLWRFERMGDGKKQLLLSVEGSPLPGEWSQALRPKTMFEEQIELSGTTQSDQGRLRLSLVVHGTEQAFGDGHAFLLREGRHLVASLGFEPVSPDCQIAWALFSVPVGAVKDIIADHFTLHNHELHCAPAVEGRQWLWVRRPELFLIYGLKERKDIHIYQSFEAEKSLFTPWGYRSALDGKLELPVDESLLVFDLQGHDEHLDTSSWWMASEMITLDELPAVEVLQPTESRPQVPVRLRYQPAEPTEAATLWLLEQDNAFALIEGLFLDLSPASRGALSLSFGQDPTTGRQCYLLRDDRPRRDAPLFGSIDEHSSAPKPIGLVPLLPEEGLFVQRGVRVSPTLPARVWRQELGLSGQDYTLLLPKDTQHARLLRIPRHRFGPVEGFVQFQIGAHPQELLELSRATAFDLLFTPSEKVAHRPSEGSEPRPQQESPNPTAGQTQMLPTRPSRAPAFKADADASQKSKLTQLEESLIEKNRKHRPIALSEWLRLASLYLEAYRSNPKPHWAHESIKALDEVLLLDRHADEAIGLERELLSSYLGLDDDESFEQTCQQLDQLQQSDDALHRRFGFRYAARMLLAGGLDSEQERALQRRLYRTISDIEEELMIREHYIYVRGLAQYFGDEELQERARLRYRQMLADSHRLQGEQPMIFRRSRPSTL